MEIFVTLSVILRGAAAVTHSLQYFYTASSGVQHLPDFVSLGLVDGQPTSYYDSVIRKAIPKQDWMAQRAGPAFWERETNIGISSERQYKNDIELVNQLFNQTHGVHTYQLMYGCEWDDETGEVNGYAQFGYDGEDFLAFDLETETWIAPKQQAFTTKQKWDHDKGYIDLWKNYLKLECPDWLKKFVTYGRSSLMRKELPSVSLLQKTSSSPVSCHATGFYPDRAMMFWRKDGEEIHEGVDHGESLPNHDGTFQMNVDLDVSSVAPEDWERYDCVFQLSGVKGELIKKLEKQWNKGSSGFPAATAAAFVIGVVAGLLISIAGLLWRRKRNKASDTSSSSAEDPHSKKQPSEEEIMMEPEAANKKII